MSIIIVDLALKCVQKVAIGMPVTWYPPVRSLRVIEGGHSCRTSFTCLVMILLSMTIKGHAGFKMTLPENM